MMKPDQPLHRIVYVSTSVDLLAEEQLEEILSVSRKNNSEKDITGILVYNDGNILQVLEGSKKDLHTLYGQISQDHRHYGCIILQDTPSETRSFADWSMGFKSVSHIEFIQLEGYWDLRSKNMPLINDDSEGTIRNILNIFVEQTR
ncbi:BLUF domain-containing protein [Paradesertivirga mongoliensis]|uniref:BLUF domain-containing protein n=1 Tax=Paradesertivirga mongoliensis TaxID=2100740 RepID=A0ABW4ZP72_9SPHI|nr:BLUF domain-containing protein [Pedobacter mongoliensis]